jgi:arylsulfatase A-like enzyme
MLTGLAPREHGVTDSEAALRPEPVTIAEAARQAGVVTAMFTANPTTTAAFGFARGWETFVARSPADEAPATAVFDDAAKWLDAHKTDRFLLFIHARGGHPPWDVGAAELKDMPPAGYAGSLDPKHAGESLGKAQRSGVAHALSDADRERAFALHARAIAAHDAALGKLVAAVRAIGREPDTTWIVTGDVGVDAGAHVPFIEQDALDEAALAVPLVVKAPKPPPHARSANPTSDVDVARTALEALGLAAPAEMRGESLWRAAQRTSDAPSRATVATVGTRFSARWGGFVLVGAREREAKLCNLSLEPECVSDVRTTHPLAAEVMHALAFDELVAKKPAGPPTHPTAIDAPLAAALRAWGR